MVKQRDGWYDLTVNGVTERIVQKMQNDEGYNWAYFRFLRPKESFMLAFYSIIACVLWLDIALVLLVLS